MTTSLTEVHLAKRLPFLAREILVLGSIFSVFAVGALLAFLGESWPVILLWELLPLAVLLLCAVWRPSRSAQAAQVLFHGGTGTMALVREIKACDDADEADYEMTLFLKMADEHIEVTHRCSYRCSAAAKRRSGQLYVLTDPQRRTWGVVHSRSALF
jgi:hypothetical protein